MTAKTGPDRGIREQLRRRSRPAEALIVRSLFVAAAISVAVTLGILWELGSESLL